MLHLVAVDLHHHRKRGTRMQATQTDAGIDAYRTGRCLTDGVHLYRLLEPLEEGTRGMTAVEDCRSLEIALVPSNDLRERMRPVGW